MSRLRSAFAGLLLLSSLLLLTGGSASADTCGPKAACLVYRQACQVAALAGLQCVD